MNRRQFLVSGSIGLGLPITGCLDGIGDATDAPSDRETPTDTSEVQPAETEERTPTETEEQPEWATVFRIFATNQTGEKQTFDVTLKRDGDQLIDESYTLGVKRGENTSVGIGEYEQAGSYEIAVESETLGSENRETLDVRQRYLDDCNATFGRIDLREDGRIQIRLGRTDKGCQGG